MTTVVIANVPGALVSLAAAVVAALFAVALLRRWAERGGTNRALLYWGASLTMFAVAALGLAWGELAGWSPAWFRLYYLFGGVLTVPWLAMGTVETAGRDTVTLRVLGVTSLLVAAAFAVSMAASDTPVLFATGLVVAGSWGAVLLSGQPEPVRAGSTAIIGTFSGLAAFAVLFGVLVEPVPVDVLPEGSEHFEPWVRSFAVGGNAIGSVLVIVGAVTASIRLRGSQLPHLQIGNLLIALGVLIAASGGAFAFLGDTEGHAIAFAVGVTVMYAGFVRTTNPIVPELSVPVLVEVYTREGCGLCDAAETRAREEAGPEAEVVFIDIDEDPDLQRRFNVRVPVVAVDGEEIAEAQVPRGAIRDAVADARRQRVR